MRNENILLFNKFLQGQATPEEVTLLIRWLKEESSFNSWADEEWKAASAEMNPDLQRQLLQQIHATIQPTPVPRSKFFTSRFHYQWILRTAAVFIILISTGTAVYQYTKAKLVMPDMIVSVDKGQKANLTLPDGSKVWVNSDSRITYGSQFNDEERIIHLDGEAYFEVAPDKDRPFIVQTKDLAVQALGTSFDVKSYSDDLFVSTVLLTGEVRVKSDFCSMTLIPNEKIIFDKVSGKMEKTNVEDAVHYSAWKSNTLAFEAETFENIVKTLQRFYNTQIRFESESLKKYRFTGSPGNTSLESVLQILSLTSPLTYEITDSMIILRENKKEKAKYEKALK